MMLRVIIGERTSKALATHTLDEFIARREQKRLLELVSRLEWDEPFDYNKKRRRD